MRFFDYTIFASETRANAAPAAEPPQMSGPPGPAAPLPLFNPQAGERPVPYKVIAFNFANALTENELDFQGNFIYFVYGTSAGGVVPIIQVRVGDKTYDQIPFTPGVSVRGVPFNKLFISNVITGVETGFLIVGYDPTIQDIAVT